MQERKRVWSKELMLVQRAGLDQGHSDLYCLKLQMQYMAADG